MCFSRLPDSRSDLGSSSGLAENGGGVGDGGELGGGEGVLLECLENGCGHGDGDGDDTDLQVSGVKGRSVDGLIQLDAGTKNVINRNLLKIW